MDLLTVTLLTVAFGLLYWWWSSLRLPANFPPGPTGIPLIGSIFAMGNLPIHDFMDKLAVNYGGIFRVPFGMRHMVVLNGWAAMKEALRDQSETFSGRPIGIVLDRITNREDIIAGDGPIWKERRRFALHHLRNLGVGKTSMEDIILEEVDKAMGVVDSTKDGKVEMANLFFMPIMNIVWGTVAGRQYAANDEVMTTFSKTIRDLFTLLLRCIRVNSIPILKQIPGSPFHQFHDVNQTVIKFLKKEIDDHERSFKEGTLRDFIDIYLAEIKAKNKSGEHNETFQKSNLIAIIHNLFIAGVETTQNTLLWSFLYMASWPEIQLKVQEEIDRVIGRERQPAYSDRTLLPYTEAVIMEINRFASIVPTSIPHTNNKETKVQGYTIPARTFVLQNIRAVHFDPKLWGDPEIFRPERFIDANGQIQRPEYFIPFSLGARQCLGEALARMEVFLFFVCVLQRFHLRIPTGVVPPSFEPNITVTLCPKPYSLTFKRR